MPLNRTTHLPGWLRQEFQDRACHDVRFVRDASSQVWESVGRGLILKVYAPEDETRALTEVAVAEAARSCGLTVAVPAGLTVHPEGVASWWHRIEGSSHADDPAGTAALLRRLHDHAAADGLPALEPLRDVHGQPPEDAVDLASALAPMRADAERHWQALSALPTVVCHGDPNPTNVLRDGAGHLVLVDFAAGGLGPRVWDVAVVAVLACETGSASTEQVLDAYGPHEDITGQALCAAMTVVAYQRALVCVHMPGWVGEGRRRVAAWQAGQPYRFAAGEHPK